MRIKALLFLVLGMSLLLAACNGGTEDSGTGDDTDGTAMDDGDDVAQAEGDGILQEVRDRGQLICGINGAVPGFGFLTPEGDYEGFDVEFCQVVAAAVLGDADAVEYVELTAENRFTALQAREIDVLIRNTTWTADRDGNESGDFTVTTFYDGQGMMVRSDGPYESLDDMNNTSICVLSGTTTELNLESQFAARDLDYEPLTFEDNDPLREAFLAERCDGWTSDKSQLAAFKAEWPEDEGGPEALTILDETLSKEPLGPVTLDGDHQWNSAVEWAVIATIQAEEFGITSDNLDDFLDTNPDEEPEIARFLGLTDFDPGLGLDPDFAVDVIEQVGNYEEIYERNVGPDTSLGLERGVNALWTDGGPLYPPPYR
jgi:general L-amino acid transport system substrate-binding protein